MSNALAIASVTRLLKDLLNDALVNGDVSGDVGTDVIVSALPPDRVLPPPGENQSSRLNLFLHRITPNPGLANTDLPTRDARGQVTTRPRLALDLHYLLTAYATQELQAEILLGYAMEMFHETAILPRNMVRAALEGAVNGAILPPAFQTADPARLADQLELIRITPQNLSLDDMSRIWTSLQTSYRTTVGYMVSVVLIERDLPKRTPLPVLSRGPVDPDTRRDAGVLVQPDLAPAAPMLTRLSPPGDRPAVRLGDVLTFSGHHLDRGDSRVRFTEVESGGVIELAPIDRPTPNQLHVTLPAGPPLAAASPLAGTGADPGAWRIGHYLAEVAFVEGARERRTNRLPLALAPRAAPTTAADPAGLRVDVLCQPRIRRDQPVALMLGQEEAVIPPLAADADLVSAVFAGMPSGVTLPVRLRVAGVDSLLIDPTATPPRFDPSQLVVVP